MPCGRYQKNKTNVGDKHENTEWRKKKRWKIDKTRMAAAAASPVPPGFTSSKLAVARAPAGPGPGVARAAAASLGAFEGVSASRQWIFSFETSMT